MNKNNSALRRYCKQVKKWLPCGGKVAKRILQDLRMNLLVYLEENPNADFEQLKEHFGQPKDIACAYIDGQNTEELLAALRLRRRVLAMVAGALMLLLAICGVYISWASHEINNTSYGHYKTETIIYND